MQPRTPLAHKCVYVENVQFSRSLSPGRRVALGLRETDQICFQRPMAGILAVPLIADAYPRWCRFLHQLIFVR